MFWRPKVRIKRRSFVVLGLCCLLVALPAALLVATALRDIGREEAVHFKIGESRSRRVILGNGVNFAAFPSGNLLENGSFEPLISRRQLVITEVSGSKLRLKPADPDEAIAALPLDDFYRGASVQVVSRRGGEQKLKLESTLLSLETKASHEAEARLAEFPSDPENEDLTIKAGDLLLLEKAAPRLRAPLRSSFEEDPELRGEWFASAPAMASLDLEEAAPDGGRSSLCLRLPTAKIKNAANLNSRLLGVYGGQEREDKGIPEGAFRLSQSFRETALRSMNGESAFQLDFWAKSENPENTVEVSLGSLAETSGNSYRRHLDADWHKYSLTFIIPRGSVGTAEWQLRFDWRGSGAIYLDRVILRSAESPSKADQLAEELKPATPDLLRFGFMPLGGRQLPEEFWLLKEPQSYPVANLADDEKCPAVLGLGTVEKICEKLNASPWICIGPYCTQSELQHLMKYLFGSASSEYGQKRLADGTALRWSDLFPRIYLEFSADEADLSGDQNLRAFAEWAIRTITETPEFKLVRQQLVFIDGMKYKDGLVLSSADMHAGDFSAASSIKESEKFVEFGLRQVETLPRDNLHGGLGRPELIRSLKVPDVGLRMSEFLASMIYSLGRDSSACLLDYGAPGLKPEQLLQGLIAVSGLEECSALNVQRLELKSQDEAKKVDDGLLAFAFESPDRLKIILLNLGESSRLVGFDGRDLSEAELCSFAADGSLLEQRKLKRNGVYSVLPGAAVSLEVKGKY